MDNAYPEEINKQLNCWVWPGTVAEACGEFIRDKSSVDEPVLLIFKSTYLQSSFDASYNVIISTILKHFTLTTGILDIVSDLYKRNFNEECRQFLNNFKFTGEIKFFDSAKQCENRILQIELPLYEARILQKPIAMLTEVIAIKAKFWKELAKDQDFITLHHLEVTGEWVLPVYLDIMVGRYYGLMRLGKFGLTDSKLYHEGAFDPCLAMFGPNPVNKLVIDHYFTLDLENAEDIPDINEVLDGFSTVDCDQAISNGLTMNIRPHLNIFSPYSAVHLANPKMVENSAVLEENYGLLYEEYFHKAPQLFGDTKRLPAPPLSQYADLGFLRIPFKKVPRISVSSLAQLQGFLNELSIAQPNTTFLFRGQTTEYYLQRSEATKLSLFGDRFALEPSITTSASRNKIDIHDFMPEWTGYLNTVLRIIVEDYNRAGKEIADLVWNDYLNLCNTYKLGHFSLATAQHYGLPSHGIDTSKDLLVSLSFSFYKMIRSQRKKNTFLTEPVNDNAQPVLYVFSIPKDHYYIDFEKSANIFKTGSRPQKQGATFLYDGWGSRKNDAVRWLSVAFYPKDIRNFAEVKNLSEYFPNQEEDIFGSLIFESREHLHASQKLKKYVDNFYWVE